MSLRWILLALSTPWLVACQMATVSVQEVVEESVPLDGGGRMVLENVNGNVEVTTWDRDEVHVEATKTASALSESDAEKALEKISVEIDRSAGLVKIGVARPKSSNWLFGGASTGVHFQISVPASAEIDLKTTNGRLKIAETRGEVHARSVNGRIDLREVRGPAEARAVNGSIRAEMVAFGDGSDLKLTTTNGSIKVSLPSDARAYLDALTTNGAIRSDLEVDGEHGRRRWRGQINGGGGQLSLRTTNGSIRLDAS